MLGGITVLAAVKPRFCCVVIWAFVTMSATARLNMRIRSPRWIACSLRESRSRNPAFSSHAHPGDEKDLIDAVMRYNDGVYLHQSIVRSGDNLSRHVDLPDAVTAFGEGQADGEWRIHCHVLCSSPIRRNQFHPQRSRATLAALRQRTRSSTWKSNVYLGRSARNIRTGSKSRTSRARSHFAAGTGGMNTRRASTQRADPVEARSGVNCRCMDQCHCRGNDRKYCCDVAESHRRLA